MTNHLHSVYPDGDDRWCLGVEPFHGPLDWLQRAVQYDNGLAVGAVAQPVMVVFRTRCPEGGEVLLLRAAHDGTWYMALPASMPTDAGLRRLPRLRKLLTMCHDIYASTIYREAGGKKHILADFELENGRLVHLLIHHDASDDDVRFYKDVITAVATRTNIAGGRSEYTEDLRGSRHTRGSQVCVEL